MGMLATMIAVGSLAAPQLKAQAIYTGGHGDIGIEYDFGESPTEFEPHWHLHDGAVYDGITVTDPEGQEFAPDELVAKTTATLPASSQVATALGITQGATVFRMGNEIYEPELGFGTEELTDTDWLDSSIVITLTGWSGPGEIAMFYGTSEGAPLYFSTLNPGNTVADNTWNIGAGAHEHLSWFFSEAGDYTVTFSWAGTYIGEGAPEGGTPVTGEGTFGVQAVPEPGTWAMVGLGMGALLFFRSRRRLSA